MWKLFKEVFKSLSKNKVIVIGLSILVFITSWIFTLLTSVNKSMNRSFDSYKNVSKLQDLTVDLNITPQGTAYNNGYFINGESQDEISNNYNLPIKYLIDYDKSFEETNFNEWKTKLKNSVLEDQFQSLANTYKRNIQNKNVLYLDFDDEEYVAASLLGYSEEGKKYFFKKSEINNLYELSKLKNSNISFNLNDVSNLNLTSKENTYLNIYEKQGYTYKQVKKIKSFTRENEVVFDKTYFLGDLIKITNENDQIFASQPSLIFINIETKQITLDFLKGTQWIQENKGFKFNTKKFLESIGFYPKANDAFVYQYDKTANKILNIVNVETFSETTELKNTLNLRNFLLEDQEITENEKINIKTNPLVLSPKLIAQEQNEINFLRWNYETTFISNWKEKWSGSYKTFMETLGSFDIENRNPLWNELETFSYWQKEEINRKYIYELINNNWVVNNQPIKINKKVSNISSNFNFWELELIKLYTNDARINKLLNKSYTLSKTDSKNIKEIEQEINRKWKENQNINNENFLTEINNIQILNDKFSIIKNNSLSIAKKEIINKIQNLVTEKNTGLRQSTTVDAVSNNGVKNVFHFINMGDENQEIDGIKLNVGKLYNEQFNKTALNNLNIDKNNVFKQKQIPPFIASKIIESLSNNLITDENYIKPKYDFIEVFDNNLQNLGLKKVLWLEKYDLNSAQNEIKYGIFWENQNFYLVNKEEILKSSNKFDKSSLFKFIESNNLTIATEFLKTTENGWIKIDSNNKNLFYVPLLLMENDKKLIQSIIKTGSVNYLIEILKNNLLNSSLSKQVFLKQETILELLNILKESMDMVNFGQTFITGQLDNTKLTAMILNAIEKMSTHQNGDLLKIIINEFLERIKNLILDQGTINEQKNYLIKQLNNLIQTISLITNSEILSNNFIETTVNLSKDPILFINATKIFINSFDTFQIVNYAKKWFDENAETKYLSFWNIINWILLASDQQQIKQSIGLIINNLDFSQILNINDEHSLINLIINKFELEKWRPVIDKFVSKLDANKDGEYANIKEGIVNILNLIDFNIFQKELIKNIESAKIGDSEKEIDDISFQNLIFVFLKSIFNVNGSNIVFKKALTNLLNLSSKVQQLGNQPIYLPAQDDDKISLLDFIGLINANFSSNDSQPNYGLFHNLYSSIKNKLAKIQSQEIQKNDPIFNEVEWKEIFDFEGVKDVYKTEKLKNKFYKLFDFVEQTVSSNNVYKKEEEKTGADLLFDWYSFSWKLQVISLLNESLDEITNNEWSGKSFNAYKLGNDNFHLYKTLIKFYLNDSASKEETDKFVNNFLEFSINEQILKLSQAKATNEQIPFSNEMDYFINEYLYNPKSANLFNLDSAGNFTNSFVEELINKNPKFKNFVLENKNELILMLGMIGQNKKYTKDNDKNYPNGIYHYTLKTFVKNYLSSTNFYEIRNEAYILLDKISPENLLSSFGISEALTTPLLRYLFPEVVILYFAGEQTSDNLIKGNLAYLLLNKLPNFELFIQTNSPENLKLKEILNPLLNKIKLSNPPLNLTGSSKLSVDKIYLDYLTNKEYPEIFGLNLIDLGLNLINELFTFTEVQNITFNNPKSYLAKVNYSYLINNNKSIYTGEIPTNPLKIEEFIAKLEDEYLIDVNGIKFIIIGDDTTVDYIYPIVDENNLQVNTKNQALVYVNNFGMDKIKKAYAGNVVKEYLLVKNNDKQSINKLESEIKEIVHNLSNTNIEKVYKIDEIDPINPERSLRISSITKIIDSLSLATNFIISLFIILVGTSTIFIVKRYINSKNKVIGILIAQGYQPYKIAFSLTAFAFVTCLIGGILGYILGNNLQYLLFNIFSSYWTLPKTTLNFNWFAFLFTIIIPMIGLSTWIFVLALILLRTKPLDLINNVNEVKINKINNFIYSKSKKLNIKQKFTLVLILNGVWKLLSFMVSILLVSITSLFGFASIKAFPKTIKNTFDNRHYQFKMDLKTPTLEGGIYKTYSPNYLNNSLYVPLGNQSESQDTQYNYFGPGWSPIVNQGNQNGNPSSFEPHILTQFSLNIEIDQSVSVNPWDLAYNKMPDTQKNRIDKIRDIVGYALEYSQNYQRIENKTYVLSINENGNLNYQNIEDASDKKTFFRYYKDSNSTKKGEFKIASWNEKSKEYELLPIKTNLRTEYRNFLINGYKTIEEWLNLKQITQNNWENTIVAQQLISLKEQKPEVFENLSNDYFISFSGIYFNEQSDEQYSWAEISWNGQNHKIYGYKQNSKFIALIDENNHNLLNKLYQNENNKIKPLVINKVVAAKYNLKIGDKLSVQSLNSFDRFIKQFVSNWTEETIEFEVIGISNTMINEEIVTTQNIVNDLLGLNNNLTKNISNYEPFNGIMTNSPIPLQLLQSTALYSDSGYWPTLDNINLDVLDNLKISSIYEQIFNPNISNNQAEGLLINNLLKLKEIKPDINIKHIYNQFMNESNLEQDLNISYEKHKNLGMKETINKYFDNYESNLFTIIASAIDSKEIEIGFINQIGDMVTKLIIATLSSILAISLVILVIISSLMINENQKNIAIWSILGYSNKEKIKMFLFAFVPFILLSLIIAIPITLGLISIFNAFLLASSSVYLAINLNWIYILTTILLVFGVFIITALGTWMTIGKMKPIELLKG
ncbi:ABC transporter permease [Mycoplasmopsis gallinarum]|uniref:ABC transporter permease n=1 Tax=Mycoplasmopsis gallinarum TaxID=29557 RepID=UPI00055D2277|nr:ABC transporter permease [Mycoplasmopsis gallinarum]